MAPKDPVVTDNMFNGGAARGDDSLIDRSPRRETRGDQYERESRAADRDKTHPPGTLMFNNDGTLKGVWTEKGYVSYERRDDDSRGNPDRVPNAKPKPDPARSRN